MRPEDIALTSNCPILKSTCVGQKCMMWRWASVEQTVVALDKHLLVHGGSSSYEITDAPASIQKAVTKWLDNTQNEPEGFCGLAGIPMLAN